MFCAVYLFVHNVNGTIRYFSTARTCTSYLLRRTCFDVRAHHSPIQMYYSVLEAVLMLSGEDSAYAQSKYGCMGQHTLKKRLEKIAVQAAKLTLFNETFPRLLAVVTTYTYRCRLHIHFNLATKQRNIRGLTAPAW